MKALKIIALSLGIAISLFVVVGIAVNIFDNREPASLPSSTSFARDANAGHTDPAKELARLSGKPHQEAEIIDGAYASSTINGITFAVLGGGNQSISALADGVEIKVDGHSVVATGNEVTVDGQSFNAGPFEQLVIDNQGVGFQVRADTRVLFELSAADALEKAADSKDPAELSKAAIAYYVGEDGVTKDRAEAARLFQKAADLDHPVAAFNLGIMYRDGDGVAQSGEAAAKYFQKAGGLGNLEAYAELALIYWDGVLVPRDQERAVEMARKNGGESRFANLILGHAAFFGLGGVTKDYSSAAQWYEKSAQAGHEIAAYNVGLMYRDGDGVAVDLDTARKWLTQARDGGAEGAAKALNDLANVDQPSNQSPNQPPPLSTHETPAQYFYAADSQQRGPIGALALKGLLRQGQLPPNTLVWRDGMAEWRPAHSVTELN